MLEILYMYVNQKHRKKMYNMKKQIEMEKRKWKTSSKTAKWHNQDKRQKWQINPAAFKTCNSKTNSFICCVVYAV